MRVGSEGIQMGDPVSKETSLSKTLLHPQHYPREKWQCGGFGGFYLGQ